MHCCVLGFLSCSLFLHMSFELKLTLLLLWLAASCSLFLHSHAWLSDCLVARLYLSPLDSRCARPLDRGVQALWDYIETGRSRAVLNHTQGDDRERGGLQRHWGREEAIGAGERQGRDRARNNLICGLFRPGVMKEPKLMGAISFFIFFFTLLVLARQVSHPAQSSRASLCRVRWGAPYW